MKLKEFFKGFTEKSQLKTALSKIERLEHDLKLLHQKVSHAHLKDARDEGEQIQPPIVVEKLHVEKIHIDKFELSNNFGALGIRELQGKLNIGANYGEGLPLPTTSDTGQDSDSTEDPTEKKDSTEQADHSPYTGPSYSIKAKS